MRKVFKQLSFSLIEPILRADRLIDQMVRTELRESIAKMLKLETHAAEYTAQLLRILWPWGLIEDENKVLEMQKARLSRSLCSSLYVWCSKETQTLLNSNTLRIRCISFIQTNQCFSINAIEIIVENCLSIQFFLPCKLLTLNDWHKISQL